jgi:hypothetical protein
MLSYYIYLSNPVVPAVCSLDRIMIFKQRFFIFILKKKTINITTDSYPGRLCSPYRGGGGRGYF